MNRYLIPAFALTSVLLFNTGCGEKAPEIVVGPAKPKLKPKIYKAPDPQAESTLREAALKKEIADLEAESEKIRMEIEQEENAQAQAALEEERAQLERDRTVWLEKQAAELAASEAKARKREKSAASSVTPSLPATADYSLFYSDLAPHGRWFDSPDYGYVWQPAVASSIDWQPYTVGSWASSDRGWTWVSDEPFGWATYHYGRWARVKNCGWIWVPGETWAPAWVSWRQNEQFIGWCPLPPATLYHGDVVYGADTDKRCGISPSCYIFISIKHFCSPVREHCEPPALSVEVCRTTLNITRLSVNRGKVDCSGPKYEWIKDRLPKPPARYNLVCEDRPDHDRRFRMERDKLLVFSPVMRAPWNAALRPLTRVEPLPVAQVELQGITVPDKALQRFREERKTWLASAARSIKAEAMRGLTERQERVATLDRIITSHGPAHSGKQASAEPGSRQQRQAELQRQIAERQASLANSTKPEKFTESPRKDITVRPNSNSPEREANAAERQDLADKAPAPLSKSARPNGMERPAKPSPELTPTGDSPSRDQAKASPFPTTPTVPGMASGTLPGVINETNVPSGEATDPSQAPHAPKVAEKGTPPAASDELAARREKAQRLKEELAARQKALEQTRGVSAKVPETKTLTPAPTPAAVPETPDVPRPQPALTDPTAAAAARLEKAARLQEELAPKQLAMAQQRQEAAAAAASEQKSTPTTEAPVTPPTAATNNNATVPAKPDLLEVARAEAVAHDRAVALAERRANAERMKEELAAKQEALQQQRATAQAAEQARLADIQAREAAAGQQREAQQTSLANQRAAAQAAAEQERQHQQTQQQQKQQEAAAAQLEQQRQEKARQEQAQATEQAARQTQQAGQEAAEQQQRDLAAKQRAAEAKAAQEAAAQDQQQRQTEERQRQAAERAQLAEAARQEQQQRLSEERARQQEAARQEQAQRMTEERQLQIAEERSRQQEAARQQQQREAEERQLQIAEERARQQEAARQQQQQREAEERQRQAAQDRARQEEAARAAAEAAKNGK